MRLGFRTTLMKGFDPLQMLTTDFIYLEKFIFLTISINMLKLIIAEILILNKYTFICKGVI